MKELIEKAISSQEIILWKGVRTRSIMNFYFSLGIGLTFLLSAFFFLNEQISHSAFHSGTTPGHSVSIIVFILGIIVSTIIYNSKKDYFYVITDKKTLIKKGGLNSEIIYVEHNAVKNLKLKKNIICHLFDVGNIFIDSGKKIIAHEHYSSIQGVNKSPKKPEIIYDKIKYVRNPSAVFNLLKKAVELSKKE
ncbi:MAG: PH domain-containing protein [Candidatus Nanoarchaeia archaeon]